MLCTQKAWDFLQVLNNTSQSVNEGFQKSVLQKCLTLPLKKLFPFVLLRLLTYLIQKALLWSYTSNYSQNRTYFYSNKKCNIWWNLFYFVRICKSVLRVFHICHYISINGQHICKKSLKKITVKIKDKKLLLK